MTFVSPVYQLAIVVGIVAVSRRSSAVWIKDIDVEGLSHRLRSRLFHDAGGWSSNINELLGIRGGIYNQSKANSGLAEDVAERQAEIISRSRGS